MSLGRSVFPTAVSFPSACLSCERGSRCDAIPLQLLSRQATHFELAHGEQVNIKPLPFEYSGIDMQAHFVHMDLRPDAKPRREVLPSSGGMRFTGHLPETVMPDMPDLTSSFMHRL